MEEYNVDPLKVIKRQFLKKMKHRFKIKFNFILDNFYFKSTNKF